MRQSFKIKKYNWSIIIYYTVNDTEKKDIIDMLEGLNCDSRTLESIKRTLVKQNLIQGLLTLAMINNALL